MTVIGGGHTSKPETTPLWRLFLINLSLSLSGSLSLVVSRCCFVLSEPTPKVYRVPRVSPGVTDSPHPNCFRLLPGTVAGPGLCPLCDSGLRLSS